MSGQVRLAPQTIGSSKGHEVRFSRDPLPVFSAGGRREQLRHGQGRPERMHLLGWIGASVLIGHSTLTIGSGPFSQPHPGNSFCWRAKYSVRREAGHSRALMIMMMMMIMIMIIIIIKDICTVPIFHMEWKAPGAL